MFLLCVTQRITTEICSDCCESAVHFQDFVGSFKKNCSRGVCFEFWYSWYLLKYVFVVPENDERYPEETHGLNLGHRVSHIRLRGDYPEHREQLEALGIVFKNNLNEMKLSK